MKSNNNKLLLTGFPGCGKTTAVMAIIEKLTDLKASGFYTKEMRQDDDRKGFEWIRLDGLKGILAHIDLKTPLSVGKYRVDVAGFEKNVLPVLDIEAGDADLFVIDEIGKMECLSGRFVDSVRKLFASEKAVLATIARKGGGFIEEVKNYPNVRVFNLTRNNNEKVVAHILKILSPSEDK
jgi:nucleoside-triphosphatase